MAKPKPVFDEIDKETEAQAIAEAEADVAAGRVVPHEDVVKWLETWGTATCSHSIREAGAAP
jgi:predicted transcriptional regulator